MQYEKVYPKRGGGGAISPTVPATSDRPGGGGGLAVGACTPPRS